jgi:hypothetical protein
MEPKGSLPYSQEASTDFHSPLVPKTIAFHFFKDYYYFLYLLITANSLLYAKLQLPG